MGAGVNRSWLWRYLAGVAVLVLLVFAGWAIDETWPQETSNPDVNPTQEAPCEV